jgi:bla regulator protein blaR1
MNALIIYMAKVAVYLTTFYLVYLIFLSRDTAYARNRVFILLSLISAFIFPHITLQALKPMGIQFFGKFLSEVVITSASLGTGTLKSISTEDIFKLIYTIYIIGVIVFIFKLLIDLFNLLFLIVRKKSQGSHIIKFTGFHTAGFSAMGYIFINKSLTQEESYEIIKHEQNHLKHKHFIDIIIIEVVKAFQWFNPAIYLINRSLRAIHEYQADKECLSSGIPIITYQNLLLSQVFKSRTLNLTNSFSNPSLIKKRMIMMTKERTKSLAIMKFFIVIPVIAMVFLAITAYNAIPGNHNLQSDTISESQTTPIDFTNNTIAPPPPPPPPTSSPSTSDKQITQAKNTEAVPIVVEQEMPKLSDSDEEVPFVVVQEMPMFPGGDINLLKYIADNTIYPASAKKNGIQGRVIIRFCVTAKGGISQVSILKGVDPELDAEAIRVVKILPAFKPGKQSGKAVPVWYMVPITFTLK